MLKITDLHASINGKEILKGINLTVNPGEIHALMGKNGAGKSTLSNVLVGNPAYEVTSGSITFNGKDLLAMKPEERAHDHVAHLRDRRHPPVGQGRLDAPARAGNASLEIGQLGTAQLAVLDLLPLLFGLLLSLLQEVIRVLLLPEVALVARIAWPPVALGPKVLTEVLVARVTAFLAANVLAADVAHLVATLARHLVAPGRLDK